MLHHTHGIVLHHLKFSETSVIARIYTEKFGLQSYLIKGVRAPKSKIKLALLEHLSLLDMVVYHKESRGLQNIKEIKPARTFLNIYGDIRKSSQALFINELILKSMKEEEANPALFRFFVDNLNQLDTAGIFDPDFHLRFMLAFAGFLGFAPRLNFSRGCCFNLLDGVFQQTIPPHIHFILPEHAPVFNSLLPSPDNSCAASIIPFAVRKLLLDKLIEFYTLHLPAFGRMKSPEILHEVLAD
jgi:DNA repair protein RecO (recombination protein O)